MIKVFILKFNLFLSNLSSFSQCFFLFFYKFLQNIKMILNFEFKLPFSVLTSIKRVNQNELFAQLWCLKKMIYFLKITNPSVKHFNSNSYKQILVHYYLCFWCIKLHILKLCMQYYSTHKGRYLLNKFRVNNIILYLCPRWK